MEEGGGFDGESGGDVVVVASRARGDLVVLSFDRERRGEEEAEKRDRPSEGLHRTTRRLREGWFE